MLLNVADLVSKVDVQRQGSITYKNTMAINIKFKKLEELRGDGKQKEAKQYITEQLEKMYVIIEKIGDCNISVSNLFFPIKSKRDYVLCEVILNENVFLPYKLKNKFNDSGSVLIGETLKEYVQRENKTNYLYLNDDVYLVNAVLENNEINKQDERVIILYDKLSDIQKKDLCNVLADNYFENFTEGVNFNIGSDSEDSVENAYASFSENFDEFEGVNIDTVPIRSQSGELNYWYKLYHTLFGGISIFFAVLNGIVVSNLWFRRRQKEYVIHLTFGYSKKRIWLLMWKELGKVSIFSLVCSVILRGIFLSIKGSDISWDMIMIQCVVMLLGAFCIMFITTINPLINIMSMDPAEGLSKCRR